MHVAGKAGKTTIVDVAREAGTSVSSASVALRGEPGVSDRTRARILDAAQRLGYRPDQRARLLRQQRSRLLGVTFSVDQSFHADVIENLYRAAEGTGYGLLLSATAPNRPAREAIADLLRDRCETLILVSPDLSAEQLAEVGALASVVSVGAGVRADGVDSVRSDDHQGVVDAVAHLVGLGHRSITYVDGGCAVMSAIRRDAYVEAMGAHGLGDQVRVLHGSPTEESGVEVAGRLLDGAEPLPTAILAHNDMIAFGLLLTLWSRSVAVPGEISVVGYDNTRMAALATVRLTSVSQDAAQLARAAVERAIARTENAVVATETVTPARLVVRETSGPPRGGA
ncbi:LacI family DNA-binding transcriptional regulator [Saccharopolyspora spinosporotrichia]|uniref:LacI family DNA-binding transcriptional regulator n=1 Tax=Saccharopolyspora erythraea TaxID=1836 RepID=A0ABN1CS97_SACER|nr:LacI family transcription regulator [Saccharopolyspora erythraea D]QRK87768.1 LacI family DNA-binding transcriptional regulator [Saccharopolyspora erythraea]